MSAPFRFPLARNKRRIEPDKSQSDLIAAEIALSTLRRSLDTNSEVRQMVMHIRDSSHTARTLRRKLELNADYS